MLFVVVTIPEYVLSPYGSLRASVTVTIPTPIDATVVTPLT